LIRDREESQTSGSNLCSILSWHSVVSRAYQLSTSNHRPRTVWWCGSTRCWPISWQRWIGLACRISPLHGGAPTLIPRGRCGLSCPTRTPDSVRRAQRAGRRNRGCRNPTLDTERRRQVDEQLVAVGITTMDGRTRDRLPQCTAQDHHHHTHRTPLPQPRARPAVAGAHDWVTEP
jgi:hypothetical protein